MKKKFLAICLAVLMCLSIFPVSVFADDSAVDISVDIPEPHTTDTEIKCSVSDTNYAVTADNADWLNADGSVPERIHPNSICIATFTVNALGSKVFDGNTVITVNGSDDGVNVLDIKATEILFEYTVEIADNGNYITEVELTGIPEATVGDTALPYSYNEGSYSAEGDWYVYDTANNNWSLMSNTDKFEDGKIYKLNITLTSASGKAFAYDCLIYVNGDLVQDWADDNFYSTSVDVFASFAEEISYVEIPESALPQPKIGDKFKDETFEIEVDDNYTVEAYWYYLDGEGNFYAEGTFEKGKAYELSLKLTPKTGYSFAPEVEYYVGDDIYNSGYDHPDPTEMYIGKTYSFKTKLDKVELLELPEAKIGQKLQESFDVKVPADAKYTAEATWYFYNPEMGHYDVVSESKGTNVVKDGRKYNLTVQILPKDGYGFEEEIILNAYGVDHKVFSYSGMEVYFDRTFSFGKTIDKVEILGYKDPAVGDAADASVLKVPENANYTIEYAEWVAAEDGTPITEIKDGEIYALRVVVTPKAGYDFARVVEYTLGSKTEKYNADPSYMEVFIVFSTLDSISEVKLSDLPEMKVGQVSSTKVTVPEGAKYTASATWLVWDEEKELFNPFEGKFEEGKVYERYITILPAEGYGIDPDAKVYADGALREDADSYYIESTLSDYFYTKLKEIDRVEVKINKPNTGDHASIFPNITLVTEEGVKIAENSANWLCGNSEYSYPMYNEYFEKDGEYGVDFSIIAKEGYVFTKDTVLVVNGKVIPADEVYTSHKRIGAEFFFNGEYEDYNPDTADVMNLPFAIVASVITLAGAVVLIKRRRASF